MAADRNGVLPRLAPPGHFDNVGAHDLSNAEHAPLSAKYWNKSEQKEQCQIGLSSDAVVSNLTLATDSNASSNKDGDGSA